jgi:Protein of unknown function (DUF1580)
VIDPLVEELITPSQATALYPRNSKGKKVHISKIYRDMDRGARGILLESLRTPRRATSREAVARFFRRLSEAATSGAPDTRHNAVRDRANPEVERELDRLGI